MKDKPSVIFRTNGSSKLGMGHLLRCMALAKELALRNWRVGFVVSGVRGEDPYARLRQSFKDVIVLPYNWTLAKDLRQLCDLLSDTRPNLTIVDSYQATEHYLEALRKTGCPVAYIDDLALVKGGMDLLINYTIGVGAKDYRHIKGARLLLGPKYCLIDEQTKALRKKMHSPTPQPEVSSSLLVTLGAGNQKLFLKKMLRSLANENWLRKVNVTSKSVGQGLDKRFEFLGIRTDFPSIIAKHHLALTGAGSTCYQLSCLGVPFLMYVVADNQRTNARSFDRLGIGTNLGPIERSSAHALSISLSELAHDRAQREKMASKGFKAVDGLGTERIAGVVERLFV